MSIYCIYIYMYRVTSLERAMSLKGTPSGLLDANCSNGCEWYFSHPWCLGCLEHRVKHVRGPVPKESDRNQLASLVRQSCGSAFTFLVSKQHTCEEKTKLVQVRARSLSLSLLLEDGAKAHGDTHTRKRQALATHTQAKEAKEGRFLRTCLPSLWTS